MLAVAVSPGLASANGCGEGGVVDVWQLHLSTPMTLDRMWSDPAIDVVEGADESAEAAIGLGGMSCGDAISCSAQLVTAVERMNQRRARRKAPSPGGPMCLPGEPGCTMVPGDPLASHMIELSHPLVPYVEDTGHDAKVVAQVEVSIRNTSEQSLFGRELVGRLERPPRG